MERNFEKIMNEKEEKLRMLKKKNYKKKEEKCNKKK